MFVCDFFLFLKDVMDREGCTGGKTFEAMYVRLFGARMQRNIVPHFNPLVVVWPSTTHYSSENVCEVRNNQKDKTDQYTHVIMIY